MPDIDATSPAFYDHEQEASAARARRAPDWGGDDVFAHAPRRRFTRPDRPHMRVHPLGTSTPVTGDSLAEAPVAGTNREPLAADRPGAADRPERAANGRRTVTITGRPGALATPPMSFERTRPTPTVADRIGGRPDRVAGWAFGLGLTLILIAVSTADAAVI